MKNLWTVCQVCKHPMELTVTETSAVRLFPESDVVCNGCVFSVLMTDEEATDEYD